MGVPVPPALLRTHATTQRAVEHGAISMGSTMQTGRARADVRGRIAQH